MRLWTTAARMPPFGVGCATMREYLTLTEAAAELDMTQDQVYVLLRAGTLIGARIPKSEGVERAGWFIERDSLEEYRRGLS